MALAFNEEQRSLKDTAKDFAENRAPVELFRKLRDEKNTDGFSREVWQEMIELGWTGIPFPESYGGYEFGFIGLAACMEELGKTLTGSPLLSSVALSGSTILYAGSEAQKEQWLGRIISGESLTALAVDESNHHNPLLTALAATESCGEYTLNGNKTCVIDGNTADHFVVAARTSGTPGDRKGISLFMVPADSDGLEVTPVSFIDSRNHAALNFSNVKVNSEQLLGNIDEGFEALDKALDNGRICLAAEMYGGIVEIFERTVEYLKERKQFGFQIGTFQALQHRAAHMFTQIEMCKSALMSALDSLENDADHFPAKCSGTKALLCETYQLVSNEAVQLHGGIGVTDELDIGLFLKRARVSAELLGNASFHYDRYATLEGF
jgi:acyl-CoA dehydrogenase